MYVDSLLIQKKRKESVSINIYIGVWRDVFIGAYMVYIYKLYKCKACMTSYIYIYIYI